MSAFEILRYRWNYCQEDKLCKLEKEKQFLLCLRESEDIYWKIQLK